MFCSKCGTQCADNAAFCNNCGNPLQAAPAQPVNPTPVAPTPVAPTPVAPTPVAPTPVAPTPVQAITVKPLLGIPFLERQDPTKMPFQLIAKLLIVCGLFLCFLGVLIPYGRTATGITYFGYTIASAVIAHNAFGLGVGCAIFGTLILLIAAGGIALAILMKGKLQVFAGICGIVCWVFNIIALITANVHSYATSGYSTRASVGYYFVFLGATAAIVGFVFTLVKKLHKVA